MINVYCVSKVWLTKCEMLKAFFNEDKARSFAAKNISISGEPFNIAITIVEMDEGETQYYNMDEKAARKGGI